MDIDVIEPPDPEPPELPDPPDLPDPEPIAYTVNYSTIYYLFDPDPDQPDPD